MGPNGAGKTTCVNILASTLIPTSGIAEVMGLDCVRKPQLVRSMVGVAPSNLRSVYWRLSGEENLRRFAALYYLSRNAIESEVHHCLAAFGLLEHAGKLVMHYSNGMRAKLILARAMIHRPPVLILDEPWATLDPESRLDLTALFRRVAEEEGKTVILCSHDLDLVQRACHRVAILDKGTIVAEGATESLLSKLPYRYVVEIVVTNGTEVETSIRVPESIGRMLSQGRRCRIEAYDLWQVLNWAEEARVSELGRVAFRQASLEDVYVSAMRDSTDQGGKPGGWQH